MNDTFAPLCCAHSRMISRGTSSLGVAMRSVKPNFAAACTQLACTLLESPVHATTRPLIGPFFSSNVITSASTWQGWLSLVMPLITGTDEFSASSCSMSWSRVRIMMQST